MKKLLLSIFVIFAAIGIANAEEVTIETNASASTWITDSEAQSTIVGNFEISNLKAGSSTACRTPDADHIRIYANAELVVANLAGQTITKIVANVTASSYVKEMTSNIEGSTITLDPDAKTITWTGSAQSVTLTASAQIRVMSLTITIEGAAAAVSTPTFDPAGGTYYAAQTVAIACATEGAKIYYTIDGTEPTSASTEYTAPLDIVSTTTVKALAVLGDDVSAVATETYTISTITQVSSVAAFVALTDGDVVQITIPLIAIYQNGQYLYVTDGTDYTLIYGSTGQTYTNGMIIPAGIEGKKTTYRGLIEFASPVQSTFQAGQDGTAVSPTVATLDQITADSQNTYVQFNGVSFTPNIDNTKQGFLSSGDASLATYNQFNIDYPTDLEKTYDVVGFVSVYNSTVQLNVVSFTEASGTGLRDLVNADVIITTDYSAIHVNTADNAQITVFNAVGQPIVKTAANAGSTLLQVAPGFYIVKVDNKTTKVLVK